MKRFFLIISVVFTCSLFACAQDFYGTTDLKIFRAGRDKEFRNNEESPLLPEDFSTFKELNYFPVNKKYRVVARFRRTADEKYFQMPTSSGKLKRFVKYGVLQFKLNGQRHQLSVYQVDEETLKKFPEYADLLFLPFRDLTGKKDTYGGGRYIDVKNPKGGKVILDFNLAYNPSCAYGSDRFNCPIPPQENSLKIEIKAGEKIYDYFGKKH